MVCCSAKTEARDPWSEDPEPKRPLAENAALASRWERLNFGSRFVNFSPGVVLPRRDTLLHLSFSSSTAPVKSKPTVKKEVQNAEEEKSSHE